MGGSTLTVGELRAALEGMADDLPVTIANESWWLNLSEVEHESACLSCGYEIRWSAHDQRWNAVAGAIPRECEHRPSSLIIGTTDDFDPRQW
jgi:hypothetical protein